MAVKLPKFLNAPPKLMPMIQLFNRFLYFLLDGGRSSAKTQTVARFLLFLGDLKRLNIVCGRETQNTIGESVYRVLKEIIIEETLDYEIFANRLVHKTTGTEFNFRGFRERGSVNIKGLEGVDILWIDEAQSITKNTLDVIIPTIRKQKSRIIFTMNRYVEQDPVYVEFSVRTDCLSIHLDYRDNQHCPEKMIREAELLKAKSYDDYCHIWLGQPLARASNHLFGIDQLRESIALDMDRIGVRRTILANDPARMGDCETTFVVLQSRGPLMWEMIHLEGYKHKKADETVGRHAALHQDLGTDLHVTDCDGMGGPVSDLVDSRRFEIREFYASKDYERKGRDRDRRSEAYFKMATWIDKGYLKILNDPTLISQLLAIRYKTKPDGTRYILSKEELAKGDAMYAPVTDIGRADASMMAVCYADDLMGPDFMNSSPTHGVMESEVESFINDKNHPEYAD